MTATTPRVLLVTALISSGWGSPAIAQSNPCALLTTAEATKHITRGHEADGETPDAHRISGGVVCVYPDGGEIGLWEPPNAEQKVEGLLKIFKADKADRRAVAGVGDKAWITFPPPRDDDERVTWLVAHVGQKLVSVALVAHDGMADGPLGTHCRKDPITPDEKEDCKKILADTSETQESLQPAVIELATLVVAKVRSEKGS